MKIAIAEIEIQNFQLLLYFSLSTAFVYLCTTRGSEIQLKKLLFKASPHHVDGITQFNCVFSAFRANYRFSLTITSGQKQNIHPTKQKQQAIQR